MKKKILIIHATAGSGHTKAAQAIYKAFERMQHGSEVKIINALDYTTAFFKFSYPRVYVFLVNRIPKVWGFFYFLLDNAFIYPLVSWMRHATNWINTRPLAKFLKSYQPDVIINTHFLAPDVITMMGRKNINAHVISVITDYRLHLFWVVGGVDTYVVSFEETKKDLLNFGIREDKIKLLGMPIDPVFSEKLDKNAILRRLNLKEGLFTVLVGSGGFGIGPVEKLVNELMDSDVPMQLIVVCGKNKTLFSAIKELRKKANFPLVALEFVDNMYELMDVSDLIVSKSGGIVCAEALAKDLPIVATFPIPGQESRNLDVLLKLGVARELEKIEDAASILKELYADKGALQAIRNKIKPVKKPEASTDIAKLVLEIISHE